MRINFRELIFGRGFRVQQAAPESIIVGTRRCYLAQHRARENIKQNPLALFPYAEHPAGRLQITQAAAVVTAARTAARTHEASPHQVTDHFFEIIFRDLFLTSYYAAPRDATWIIREMNHSPQRIFDLTRYLHQAHFFTDLACAAAMPAATEAEGLSRLDVRGLSA